MDLSTAAILLITLLVLGYLITALLRPERF